MTVPGNLAGLLCNVEGCDRAGVLALTRTMSGDNHPRVVLLTYCAEHYGQANRFKAGRRDRRAVQTTT